MKKKIKKLKKYKPGKKDKEYKENVKKVILDNMQRLFEGRNAVIEAFEKNIFRLYSYYSDSDFNSDPDFDYGPTKLE